MTTGGARPGSDAGHGGQNYLASVSDLVSALIFVFIIMLAVFAYQLANVTEEQADVTDELRAADETRREILRAIEHRLQAAGIRVEVLPEQGVLRLSDNAINFPSGGELPVADHRANVGRLAHAIAEVVPCYVASRRTDPARGRGHALPPANGDGTPPHCHRRADPAAYDCPPRRFPWLLETLLIEGHTDDVPVAPGNRFRDNLELSSMRAATVHRMTVACEPGVERLLNLDGHPVLSTSGYGFTRPATSDPARADENRRIDLRFLLEPPPGGTGTARARRAEGDPRSDRRGNTVTAASLKRSLTQWTGLPSIEHAFEPRMTRRAASTVEKLLGDVAPREPSAYDLRALYRRVAACWRGDGSLADLKPRDLQRLPWVLFYPARPQGRMADGNPRTADEQVRLFSPAAGTDPDVAAWLGAEPAVVREYRPWLLTGRRTRSVLALLHEFLRIYPDALPAFEEWRRLLEDAIHGDSSPSRPSLRRWRGRCREFGLLHVGAAGTFVQKLLSAPDPPEDVLCQAGLEAGLSACGFLESGIRACLPRVESQLKDGRLDDLRMRRLLTLLEEPAGGSGEQVTRDRRLRFDDRSMRLDIATALLRPFADREAERATRERLQPFFLRHFGDPRLRSGKRGWAGISEEIRWVVIGWLNERALEQFFLLVKDTARDRHWRYREAFWRAFLPLKPRIWFVLGRRAALALQRMNARAEEREETATLRGAQGDQSVLLVSLPGVTVAEWSHDGACRFWLEGSASVPPLYSRDYSRSQLTRDADHSQRHDGSPEGRWQDRIMAWLRDNTGVHIDRSEYFPARLRRHRYGHGLR